MSCETGARVSMLDDYLQKLAQFESADLLVCMTIAELAIVTGESDEEVRGALVELLAAVSVVFGVDQTVEEEMGGCVKETGIKYQYMCSTRSYKSRLAA